MKNLNCILNYIFILTLASLPQKSFAQETAGQAGEYLRWGVGAKAMAFGRAFTSIADDASSLYWNPAGMHSLTRSGGTMMFMHLPLQQDASVNYLAAALPLRLLFVKSENKPALFRVIQELKLGVGLLWHSLGEFDFYNSDAAPLSGSAGNKINQSATFLSAAYPLNPLLNHWLKNKSGWTSVFRGDLEFGFTTKLLRQNLFGEQGSATSFDIGFKYTHHSGLLNLGLVWRDLNSPHFAYDTNLEADTVPTNAVMGVSLTPPWGRLRGLLLSFDYDVTTPGSRKRDLMFGVEYDFSVLSSDYPIRLRLGSNSNHESLTFGVQFSPEGLFDQDWLPSGDWTYANQRSGYDAIGARYSFSLDRNPFTAKYWYLNGRKYFAEALKSSPIDAKDSEIALRYMKNAEEAKNPGGVAYRYEASLRTADINFLMELHRLRDKGELGTDHRQKRFKHVVGLYLGRAANYQSMDYGKGKIDPHDYFRSFSYYLQSLILSGKPQVAAEVAAAKGTSWGQRTNVLSLLSADTTRARANTLHYLQAYAALANNEQSEALRMLEKNLREHNAGRFLAAHILFLQKDYLSVLKNISEIDLNDAHFPENIFLPITRDRYFGDEVLFLKGIAQYKLALSEDPGEELVQTLAKIPRFFPRSDLAQFLTNGKDILHELLVAHEAQEQAILDDLVERMVEAYIESSAGGTLVERFYTFNYR